MHSRSAIVQYAPAVQVDYWGGESREGRGGGGKERGRGEADKRVDVIIGGYYLSPVPTTGPGEGKWPKGGPSWVYGG